MPSSESFDESLVRCDRLVRAGLLDQAEPELKALAERESTSAHARKLLAVCRQLRRLGIIDALEQYSPKQAALSDDRANPDFASEAGVLISRKPGSRDTVLVFTGRAKQVWISIHLLHRFLSRYDCNIVYLRDARKRAYLRGIPEFGADQRSLLLGLSDLVSELSCEQLFCLGSSAGGYMALRAGVELGAIASLAFSPATSESGFASALHEAGIVMPDLRDLYRSADRPPRTTLVFAENHAEDAQSCKRLGDLPGVKLVPVPNYDGHDVIAQTIATGSFPRLIDELLGGGRESASQTQRQAESRRWSMTE